MKFLPFIVKVLPVPEDPAPVVVLLPPDVIHDVPAAGEGGADRGDHVRGDVCGVRSGKIFIYI